MEGDKAIAKIIHREVVLNLVQVVELNSIGVLNIKIIMHSI
jgi:hypothetical protein